MLALRGSGEGRGQEVGAREAITGGVAAGIGVPLLPRGVVEQAETHGDVALHALPAEEAMVDTLLIRRRDGVPGSALAALMRTVQDRPAAPLRHAAE